MIHKLENFVRVSELAPTDTLKRIGMSEGMVFCDIGAGTGVFTLPAVDISKSTVYAVEISEQMRDILRGKCDDIEVVDDIRAVPDACCDVALLCTVLHELGDIPGMLSQIKRILKKCGTLVIIEFHKRRTPMGPPVEWRLSEDKVISDLKNVFSIKERFDLGENFYCMIFRKGL